MQMDYGQPPSVPQHVQAPPPDFPLPELSGDMGLDPLIAPGHSNEQERLEWLDTDI